MKSKWTYVVAGLLVAVGFVISEQSALAEHGHGRRGYSFSFGSPYGYGSYYGGGSRPIYHPPSVHYDRVYHPTDLHWTPRRGWHTHGHYDLVPHYTPGHFDTLHGDHIHANPYYHHR